MYGHRKVAKQKTGITTKHRRATRNESQWRTLKTFEHNLKMSLDYSLASHSGGGVVSIANFENFTNHFR